MGCLISVTQASTGHKEPAVFWLHNVRGLMRISSDLLALSAAAVACVGTPCGSQKVTDVEATIHVDGFDRTYLVHPPSRL